VAKNTKNALKGVHEEALDALPPPPLPGAQGSIHRKNTSISSVERQIVAACLIGEAGGEGTKGMQAVMNVIANRAGGDPSKFAAICLKPYQFSMFNSATVSRKEKLGNIVAKMAKHNRWGEALGIVDQAASGTLKDDTKGAKYYHAPSVSPRSKPWRNLQPVTKIGSHQFYADKR